MPDEEKKPAAEEVTPPQQPKTSTAQRMTQIQADLDAPANIKKLFSDQATADPDKWLTEAQVIASTGANKQTVRDWLLSLSKDKTLEVAGYVNAKYRLRPRKPKP